MPAVYIVVVVRDLDIVQNEGFGHRRIVIGLSSLTNHENDVYPCPTLRLHNPFNASS
jgi:hypothetical protein